MNKQAVELKEKPDQGAPVESGGEAPRGTPPNENQNNNFPEGHIHKQVSYETLDESVCDTFVRLGFNI
jgi:hypothetical protein